MAYNPHMDYNLNAQGGRVVSFSFKIEKSQLMAPRQTDYVLVSQDGNHCGGSAKFNGVTSDDRMNYNEPHQPNQSSSVVCDTAPDYVRQNSSHPAAHAGSSMAPASYSNYVKPEPTEDIWQQISQLNDSGFVEHDPNLYVNQPDGFVTKNEPQY